MLIEVADSSLAYDRTVKVALYASHGIPELWIVDLIDSAVDVFAAPREGSFSVRDRRTQGILRPKLVSNIAIDVEALLA